MKKLRIIKHNYGVNVQLGQHVSFDIDINHWHFIPSIEFVRRPGVLDMLVFAFLCFNLTFYRWRFDKR